MNLPIQSPTASDTSAFAAGAAYVDGAYMPLSEARIPVTDWGYRRSDVVYDVVSVWDGSFFRINDHLKRFRASMEFSRLVPAESDDDIRAILHRLVALAGLREAYVAMDCLRGRPAPGTQYHPKNARPYLIAYAIPFIWLMKPEIIERGAHMVIASTPRIPESSVNARAKNFHWADMTAALFEADEQGADNPILLDAAGNVTEGPGYNVFCITNGVVATPDRNVLGGITRLSVIELCAELGLPCEVRDVSVDELRDADEILVSSTAGGPIGVSRLDGRILNNDRPGPLTQKLRETYWEKRKQGWHGEPVDYTAV
ncbi:branched-chain amino acid aminotransferase [Ancylobacter sp. 3268]|uniref:aminotransferase class IV n=1 Tax=Ancylobacter sp. 3268 TaxID=2817752 RepID=UPI002861BBCC|nr:aminotransferase class IV [Ancylobacter sp. 3268]MDR6953321.1 branched-chain amino acid aminotransferase [Ancylobacter sp. 3268]